MVNKEFLNIIKKKYCTQPTPTIIYIIYVKDIFVLRGTKQVIKLQLRMS